MTQHNELKSNIEKIAKEENKTELEVITEMQAGAVALDCEKTLDMLCKVKREYIKI